MKILSSVSDQVAIAIELKLNEESLKRSEYRFRNLVEHSRGILYLTDQFGRLEYISPAIETLTGYPADYFMKAENGFNEKKINSPTVKNPFHKIIHPQDQTLVQRLLLGREKYAL